MEKTNSTPLEQELAGRYRMLGRNQLPSKEWIQVQPAVPFVGSGYGAGTQTRVLVYGSAENLNWPFSPEKMTLFRNREQFDLWKAGDKGRSNGDWFPRIHMTPVSDGTLLTAARYLLDIFGEVGFSTSPEDFLQQIAVGNYGKFSLAKGKNFDYASGRRWLEVSHPYIIVDLEVLRPDIVILPRTIYENAFIGVLATSKSKPERVWRIYQTNPGVINRHIDKQLKNAGIEAGVPRFGWPEEWIKHIGGHIRMDRYLDWLDWHAGRLKGQTKPSWSID